MGLFVGIADDPVALPGTVSNLSWTKVRQLGMEALGVVELDPGAHPCDSVVSIVKDAGIVNVAFKGSEGRLNVRVIVTDVGLRVRLGDVVFG
nr:hypothetical protein [Corynebacterium pseudogenitalium]